MGLIVQVIASISLMYIALVSVVPFKINNKYLMYTVFISLVAVVPLKLQIEYLGIIVLTFIQIIFVYFHNQNIFTSKEQWEVGETIFFESDEQKEIWKLQWKERGRNKQVALENFPCKVGKIKEEVSIVINDISVSRVHCQFVKKENRIAVMDLNSTNGTSLNGMPLENGEMIEIEKNDEILIGKVKVLVV